MSDWQHRFGVATGSVILTFQRFSTANIQRMLHPTLLSVDSDDLSGAASAVLLLISYNPGNLFELPHCWQRWFYRVRRYLTSSPRLTAIFGRIQSRLPNIDWRDVRIFGGLYAVCSIGILQAFNLYRWQCQGIERAASYNRIGYVSTIILEITFYRISRRRHFNPRDYFMRTFLSLMNIPGILIYRRHMWERMCFLFTMSSLSILFRRYWDMINVLYTFERLVNDLRLPSPRLPTVAVTEDGYLKNESNHEQDDGSNQ